MISWLICLLPQQKLEQHKLYATLSELY